MKWVAWARRPEARTDEHGPVRWEDGAIVVDGDGLTLYAAGNWPDNGYPARLTPEQARALAVQMMEAAQRGAE
jgi:hypothetical protein